MDGLHVLSEMKRMAIQTRVILLTGHLSLTDEQKGIKEGAFAYLFKPVPITKLVGVIRSAVEKK